ncbi:thioredoxin family protein [Chryseolinea lacunae]|uniref:Thioredoxin family protein n=1 Tax=Chryseolinea lacunae TaxID=2801331 RepID=A0ABS1KTV9_9BACT|nr:thioredoxin family protein [Chryseolinea lacunae]MBL0741756.1 thioredoxin family protein [Chryseolinea lacunae]
MKTKIKFLAVVIGAAFLFVSATSSYQLGDSVSDFSLKNVDGKMVALSDFKSAKGAIVIFDCNTCPYSRAYNDRIVGLNKKFASQGFPVIAINPNDPQQSPGDSFEEMAAQAKSKHYDFPYLVDASQEVAKAFGASNTPHVFVLKKEGNEFKVAYIGTIDNNTRDASAASKKYVEDAVNALLQNKPVPTAKTKAIGCGIKWKNS